MLKRKYYSTIKGLLSGLAYVSARLAFILTAVLLLSGCYSYLYRSANPASSDHRYDTEFPYASCSEQLKNILASVKKVNGYFSYRTYVFGENSKVTLNDIKSGDLVTKAEASLVTNEATSGTALIIHSDASEMALLTCSHIVSMPDTLINWSDFSDLGSNPYIHSISLKIRQQLVVKEVPEATQFLLLAKDVNADLAIIGHKYTLPIPDKIPPVFPYPVGNSDELEWGNFIYLAGFPAGQLMLTKGIVSKAQAADDNFLTDAPFNEGFSGGIALAVRDGVPNFEWVGIGCSVSARSEYFLKPERENFEYNYNPAIPYSGEVYVHQKKEINYGVTWVIPINAVKSFYRNNQVRLKSVGFDLDNFFMD